MILYLAQVTLFWLTVAIFGASFWLRRYSIFLRLVTIALPTCYFLLSILVFPTTFGCPDIPRISDKKRNELLFEGLIDEDIEDNEKIVLPKGAGELFWSPSRWHGDLVLESGGTRHIVVPKERGGDYPLPPFRVMFDEKRGIIRVVRGTGLFVYERSLVEYDIGKKMRSESLLSCSDENTPPPF